MSDELNGFLNVFKAPGESSHGVVSRIRRLTHQKRVGHAGTLDPAAVGVLPVALGSATRFSMWDGWTPKIYWADIEFGTATDTDDQEGQAVASGDPTRIDLPQIEATLMTFLGDISQIPPSYSAVKLGGARAYDLARRGRETEIAPRQVRIDAIRVVSWDAPRLSVVIQCGSGTYIRSLARDLGRALACPAHLAGLVRLRVGPLGLSDALSYAKLDAIAGQGSWREYLYAPEIPSVGLPVLVASPTDEDHFVHGRTFSLPGSGLDASDLIRVYSEAGTFLGIARLEGEMLQPSIVQPVAE